MCVHSKKPPRLGIQAPGLCKCVSRLPRRGGFLSSFGNYLADEHTKQGLMAKIALSISSNIFNSPKGKGAGFSFRPECTNSGIEIERLKETSLFKSGSEPLSTHVNI